MCMSARHPGSGKPSGAPARTGILTQSDLTEAVTPVAVICRGGKFYCKDYSGCATQNSGLQAYDETGLGSARGGYEHEVNRPGGGLRHAPVSAHAESAEAAAGRG